MRSQDISNLVLTGITTDVGVNSTLIAASTRNYRVTAVKDSCASPWPELHEACFQIWEKKFARVRNAGEIVREITADGNCGKALTHFLKPLTTDYAEGTDHS